MNTTGQLIACHDCDLLQQLPPLEEGQSAYCPRCYALLYKRKKNSIDRSLALTLTGLILFLVANLLPFLTLNAQGQVQDSNLISASYAMFEADRPTLATVVFLTTFLIPLLDLAGLSYILISMKLNLIPPGFVAVFKFLRSAQPWGMLEVFMLGVLVAAVKLGDLATVIPGPAMYSFAILIFVLAAISTSLDPHLIWNRVSEHSDET